ncbi:MAG: CotH kinase family protein, partial [Bacteroidota bacterium]
MREVKAHLLIVSIFALPWIPSCKQAEAVDPVNTNTFLNDIIGIDNGEKLLLYNGESIDLAQESLNLDNAAIVIQSEPSNQITLGKRYQAEWKEEAYNFFRTELPILKVQTRNSQRISETYESSKFTLIEAGQITLSGNMGIKLRGNTSLSFPKKSYRIELWADEEGLNNENESVLKMRDDDDWLLDGMWNEPLSIRDKSAMEMWLDFGRVQDVDRQDIVLGAAREYCELFIDGAYKGLYYIGERLDRKQLKLDKCTDQSDGGELYKAKAWDAAVIAFSLPEYDNNNLLWGGYEVKYPEETGKFDWGKLKAFKEYFKGSLPNDFENVYPQKVDVDNLIDYFILINILGAFDNAGNNVFIARKDQSSPYYFVSWDYDATVGLDISGNA